MTTKRSKPIAPKKKKLVGDITDLIKENRTILLASIKNLPGSQFQEISKKLRGKAVVKVPRKNLLFRAMDASGKEAVKTMENYIKSDVAILFSNLDPFELAGVLLKNKIPAKAKPGQEAPEDIEIKAGPTDLVPGPAISELGAVGIQIQIQDGKIHIKAPKIIAKKGAVISQAAADIMSKLGIKPFSIGFIPLSAFDAQEGKLYVEINIDPEGTLASLKEAHGRALPFAVSIGYPTKDTINFLIGKANSHARALEKLKPAEKVKEVAEEKAEEVKENSEEKKEEVTEDKEESQTPDNKSGEDK